VLLEVLDWGGTGDALMLLPGDGNTAHVFDDFAPKLSDSFHVLAVTRRGSGASSQPDRGYDIERRTADLLRVAYELQLQQFHLAGHSIAGEEMTRFAWMHPGRVGGLVFLDAAYDRVELGRLALTLRQYFVPPPRPSDADLSSSSALLAYTARVEVRLPESEIRASRVFGADGRFVRRVTSLETAQAIAKSIEPPAYSRIKSRALAIYAVPVAADPQGFFTYYPLVDSANQERLRSFLDRSASGVAAERERFRRETRHGEVVELPGAHHYVFVSHEQVVLREMRRFLSAP
jgi:non-heme chloroperoxidase